jgi:hypothetical protein
MEVPTGHQVMQTRVLLPGNSRQYQHRTVTGGIGHNLPQQAPEAFGNYRRCGQFLILRGCFETKG